MNYYATVKSLLFDLLFSPHPPWSFPVGQKYTRGPMLALNTLLNTFSCVTGWPFAISSV